MKYLCLIFDEERALETMPQGERQAFIEEYAHFTADLKQQGRWLTSHRLHPVATATTVRVRQGQRSLTDGPFAETREQLGGFYLIEAKDLNEAVEVASRIPSARTGCIEVRPVMEVPVPVHA